METVPTKVDALWPGEKPSINTGTNQGVFRAAVAFDHHRSILVGRALTH